MNPSIYPAKQSRDRQATVNGYLLRIDSLEKDLYILAPGTPIYTETERSIRYLKDKIEELEGSSHG